jgi:hypothetical protein
LGIRDNLGCIVLYNVYMNSSRALRALFFGVTIPLFLVVTVSSETNTRKIYAPNTERLNFVDSVSLHVYCSLSKLFDIDSRSKCFVSVPSEGGVFLPGIGSETINTLNSIKADLDIQRAAITDLRRSSSSTPKVINNTIVRYMSTAAPAQVGGSSMHNTVLSKYAHAFGQDNVILTRATGSYIFGANIVNAIAGSVQIGTYDRAKLFIGGDGFVGIASSTDRWARTTRIADEQLRVGGRIRAAGFDVDSNADLAENFPSDDKGTLPGHIVQFSDTNHKWQGYDLSGVERASIARLAIGVVATDPGVVLGVGTKGVPVAFSGRIPVRVTAENGPVVKGDRITLSARELGVGAKLTSHGQSVGVALSNDTGSGMVLMLVRNEYMYDNYHNTVSSTSTSPN